MTGTSAPLARILGVSVGDDGRVGVFPRDGAAAGGAEILLAMTALEAASRISVITSEWRPDAIVADLAEPRAAGLVDALRSIGLRPLAVRFAGAKAGADRRTEARAAAARWLDAAGRDTPCPLLADALAATFLVAVASPSTPLAGSAAELRKRRAGWAWGN